MSRFDIDRNMTLLLMNLSASSEFKRTINYSELLAKESLIWVEKVAFSAARDIMSKLEENLSRWKSVLEETQVLIYDNLSLHKLGTEEIRQVIRASPAVHTFARRDSRIRE